MEVKGPQLKLPEPSYYACATHRNVTALCCWDHVAVTVLPWRRCVVPMVNITLFSHSDLGRCSSCCCVVRCYFVCTDDEH